MGIQDRRYYDDDREGGGFRDAFRRMFAAGDFFAWSLPLFRVAGIRVRVHLLFILYIVGTLVGSLRQDTLGIAYTALGMGILFTIVLLHEFGHCFACRWVGGEADEILLWPLGGLAMATPPHEWRASLVTTLGGPAVNVVLLPITAAAVLAAGGGWDAVIFNYFDPGAGIGAAGFTSFWQVAIWWTFYTNLALLAFNMLLPMYPMDCGRVVQELLWARTGYRRSLHTAATFGLIMAVVVGVFGMTTRETTLMVIALFCGLTCYTERRKAEFLEEDAVPGGYDFSRGYTGLPGGRAGRGGGGGGGSGGGGGGRTRAEERKYKEALKRQQREQQEQAETDRILAKIAASGMDSLTRAERKALQRATENKRKGG